MNNTEELENLLALIELERQEEVQQYQTLIRQTDIARRRAMGLTWYPVAVGQPELGVGEQWFIEIRPTVPQPRQSAFQAGQSAALFSNAFEGERPTIKGIVVEARHDRLRLSVSADELPDWLSDGKLGIDIVYDETTFKEMDIALRKAIGAQGNRLAELRDVLLGKKTPFFDFSDKERLQFAPNIVAHLNPSQRKALELATTSRDIAIVHGPPGTGKTSTLLSIIRHTLKYEKQTLVCAPSNTAVDLLAQKLADAGVRVLRLGATARMDAASVALSLNAQIARHPDYKRLRQLHKEAQQMRTQALKYKRSFDADARAERQSLLQNARQTLDYARNIEKMMFNDTLEQAQAICTTLAGASLPLVRGRIFETVFMDEAAQALEPAAWIPICRARKVVLAGDHCQLPPTVKSNKAQKGGLAVSLFEKCIQRHPTAATMLQTQYRMNAEIVAFSDRFFYQNSLESHASVANQTLADGMDTIGELLITPFDFIDTAGCGFSEQQNPETLSHFNPAEADLLLRYLSMLYTQWQEGAAPRTNPPTTGIISPYREQVNYLTEQLPAYEALQPFLEQIQVHTIDGFQGQERDIIAISLVRSNDDGQIGFLADTRRMNVAMTRARRKLMVAGDSATIANHAFYRQLTEHAEHTGAYRSAWEWAE